MMKRHAETMLPTKWGKFKMIAYADGPTGTPHMALVSETFSPDTPTLVRMHSECMTGDLFGSSRCDCGEQLEEALKLASRDGGVILYLRQEGRGIGIINKMKAYNLQDKGLNTADANMHLGFEVDSRNYQVAIDMLVDLGIYSIRLMTNNPLKLDAFKDSPITVTERVPVLIPPKNENLYYLITKQEEMGHMLNLNGEYGLVKDEHHNHK